MVSKVFSFMMIFSFISALLTGNVERMGIEIVNSLSDAVTFCISILGMMGFWTGFMSVIKDAGILKIISALSRPFLKFVYGKNEINDENLNNLSASIGANFLGLGNAALPLGITAIKSFQKKNGTDIASDSSIMFGVLNTVPFQLVPSTLIAMRTNYGAMNPFDVVPYIWICSVTINIFAVIVCKMFAFVWRYKK